MTTSRDKTIDILKGIGIIMMTLGHCHAPCRFTFYLFHVAIFFVASGFFLRESNSDDFRSTVKYTVKKFRSLWLPYFLCIAILSVTHNLQLKIGILTTDERVLELTGGNYDYEMLADTWRIPDVLNSIIRAFFFGGGVSFAGNIWFLRVLLMISVVYCGISFLAKSVIRTVILKKASAKPGNDTLIDTELNDDVYRINLIVQTAVSVVFLACGFYLQKKGLTLYGIGTTLSCYILYHAGSLIGRNAGKIGLKTFSVLGVISIVLLTILYIKRIGVMQTGLVNNAYLDPVFLVITSLAGWFAVYTVSYFLNKIRGINLFLSECGRHSLIIMIMHPICFKVVNMIQVRVYGLPHYALAAYPVIYSDHLWWLMCTIVGVLIPLGIGKVYLQVSRALASRRSA